MYEQTTTPQNVGHLFGVLPIAAFEELDHYYTRMSKAIGDIRGTKKAPGVDQIYLPGERERLALVERRSRGIPLNAAVYDELSQLGAKYGVALARKAA